MNDLYQRATDQFLQQLVESHGYDVAQASIARLTNYEVLPPTIKDFLDTSEFLKDSLWNEEKDESIVYSVWRNALYNIYPSPFYSPYREIIATGSIGGGKTTFAKIGMLYDVVKMLCLKNPQSYYELSKATKLVFAVYSSTLGLAKGVLFDELLEWLRGSRFLNNALSGYSNKKYSNPTMFKKGIDIKEGSRFTHTLGQAVAGGVLSELNFQRAWENQAYKNYTNVKRRIQSRFLGKIPGRMWLDSSKSDEAAFLEGHIKTVRTDPEVLIFDNAVWEVKPQQYCGKTFKVFVGDSIRDPFVLHKGTDIIGIDEAHIIDVPTEHKREFEDDIFHSLQDIAGRSTSSIHKFIPSVEKIEECLIRKNPVYQDVIQLDFYDQNDNLIKYVDINKLKKNRRPRFLHLDLGLRNDIAGLAMSCVSGFVSVSRTDNVTGRRLSSEEPIYYTDFVIGIKPASGQEVPIYKIKNFVKDLASVGIPIVLITADGFQSENFKQDLWMLGFAAQIQSVDRTRIPYDHLKNVILEGRYNGVRHPRLQRELKELLDLGKKIDHPHEVVDTNMNRLEGSKDLADAVCGSIFGAYQNRNRYISAHAMTSETFLEEMNEEVVGNVYEQIFDNTSQRVSLMGE
jgi:hypothetical protein